MGNRCYQVVRAAIGNMVLSCQKPQGLVFNHMSRTLSAILDIIAKGKAGIERGHCGYRRLARAPVHASGPQSVIHLVL